MFKRTIDETQQTLPIPADEIGEIVLRDHDSLAREIIDCRESLTRGMYPYILHLEFRDTLGWIAFAMEHPSRRRRVPMDVEDMVSKWVPLVRKLAVAHDVDEKDAASSALDELLTPLLAAPVTQLRTFYRSLVEALKADPSIPWAVWKLFEFWGTSVLDKIDKEEIVGLKKELATRIAENSIKEIPTVDWIASMVGALQWRSPEKLKQIEEGLAAGEKPRVRGKESCLFLTVGTHEVML
jgi:hypothetical protein